MASKRVEQDRYRHRVEKVNEQGLSRSACGKIWTPTLWGQYARVYGKCPICYAEPSKAKVAA